MFVAAIHLWILILFGFDCTFFCDCLGHKQNFLNGDAMTPQS